MGAPSIPKKAALVISIIFGKDAVKDEALRLLADAFGPGTPHPQSFMFDQTAYYASEMGSPLRRVLWIADAPVGRHKLAAIKLRTNDIERRFARPDGTRRVNLDPGLLSAESFILATTKNFSHRVYLRKGIYADLTLVYRKGEFVPLEWTYPDYAGAEIRNVLKTWRNAYMKMCRKA